jgi:APA family basic amino acid/polyamine antiporter
MKQTFVPENEEATASKKLVRSLGLVDAAMIVVGSMIGSGIYLTSAESSRLVGSPGWLLAAWALAGVLTITGALCCAELAVMMPRAGGQYVFLREAYSPGIGFLFGWSLFLVIQTGTIAAVAVAFANFMGVLTDKVAADKYLIAPHGMGGYAIRTSS